MDTNCEHSWCDCCGEICEECGVEYEDLYGITHQQEAAEYRAELMAEALSEPREVPRYWEGERWLV